MKRLFAILVDRWFRRQRVPNARRSATCVPPAASRRMLNAIGRRLQPPTELPSRDDDPTSA